MPGDNKQIHIRLDSDLFSSLSEYTLKSGQTIQNAVSGILNEKLNIKKKITRKKKAKFTFIDLFAGIGGMRLAYEFVGGKCVYSNEWNKFSQQTYEANFGEKPDGDITKVDEMTIPDHDILVAGFPCQPFSIAGVSKRIH